MARSRALLQLGAVVALAAIVVVGAILLSGGGGDDDNASAKAEEDVYAGIQQDGIHLGKPGAAATLVEIADLQCPFCAAYSREALPSVVRDYVRPGRVRYELHFRSFLGRDSVRAAGAAAYAASENRMYQFADAFYRNQGPEESGYADSDFIRTIARQVQGLDPEKAVAAANDPLSWPAVKAGEVFARNLGSTSTPDFYVRKGGRLQPLNPQGTAPEDYARALDAALAGT
ncbi:MAG TPA: thioredoxin domain-containing protein [Solirubrobacteraceae bacterium]